MSKTDYFVIIYKILSYLYDCLKEDKKPSMDYLHFNTDTFPVGEGYWTYIFAHLLEEGLIEDASIITFAGGRRGVKTGPNFAITPAGIAYLHENSLIAKAKAFVKTIKETVQGL